VVVASVEKKFLPPKRNVLVEQAFLPGLIYALCGTSGVYALKFAYAALQFTRDRVSLELS